MHSYDRLFIDGGWVGSTGDAAIEVVSPHREEVIGRVAAATAADVDHAVTAARAAFDDGEWPQLTPARRADYLTALAQAYEPRVEEIAALVTEEMGAPISYSRFGQALAGVMIINSFVKFASRHLWEQTLRGDLGDTLVRRVPVGVTAAIVPWNMPQLGALTKIVPALLAGCTVVLKPAAETPIDAMILADIIDGIGLPKGVVNIVPGGREVGEHLVTHPAWTK